MATFAQRAILAAQITTGIAVTLIILYVGKPVLVTLLVSALIAFTLEPLVCVLERIRVPGAVGAFLAVMVLLGVVYGFSYFFYSRAVDFAAELPKYASRMRSMVSRFEQQTKRLEQTREKIVPSDNKNAVPVKVEQNGSPFTRYMSAATEAAITLSFIPFLVYFMLNWHHHARRKTVKLVAAEHRETARQTLDAISSMIRTFITGNFVAGVVMSLCSIAVFGFLHLPYFYFVGFISGFLSLVPYLGVILAGAAPLIVGLGTLSVPGVVIVIVTVIALHLLALNVLYPKVIGSKLQLNPLAVAIGLLIWGFMWGAMGLILAIPIMGAIKIFCDHLEELRPIGEWLGD